MSSFPWSQPIVLASGSPRRRDILDEIGVPITVMVPDCVEPAPRTDEGVGDYAVRVALTKARAVVPPPGVPVLAADTVVILGDTILGKPKNAVDAGSMLTALSGRSHRVVTGVAIDAAGRSAPPGWESRDGCWVLAEETHVRFRELSRSEIGAYVSTDEPLDKAGAYGIQGSARAFVSSVSGCYYNVVGLPVARVVEALLALAGTSGRQ